MIGLVRAFRDGFVGALSDWWAMATFAPRFVIHLLRDRMKEKAP